MTYLSTVEVPKLIMNEKQNTTNHIWLIVKRKKYFQSHTPSIDKINHQCFFHISRASYFPSCFNKLHNVPNDVRLVENYLFWHWKYIMLILLDSINIGLFHDSVAYIVILQFLSKLQRMLCEEYGLANRRSTLLELISTFSLVSGLKR